MYVEGKKRDNRNKFSMWKTSYKDFSIYVKDAFLKKVRNVKTKEELI